MQDKIGEVSLIILLIPRQRGTKKDVIPPAGDKRGGKQNIHNTLKTKEIKHFYLKTFDNTVKPKRRKYGWNEWF